MKIQASLKNDDDDDDDNNENDYDNFALISLST